MFGKPKSKSALAIVILGTLVLLTAGAAVAHANGFFGGRGMNAPNPAVGYNATEGTYDGRTTSAIIDVAGLTISSLALKEENATRTLAASITLESASEARAATGRGPSRGVGLIDGEGNRLSISDGPRAGFMAASRNGTTLTIVLPEGALVEVHEAVESWSPAGATIDYGNALKANIVLDNAELSIDGQTLTVTLAEGGVARFNTIRDAGDWCAGHAMAGPGFGPGPGIGGHARRGPPGPGPFGAMGGPGAPAGMWDGETPRDAESEAPTTAA